MNTSDTETPSEAREEEFVGYGPAAEYLGLSRNTLSSYVSRGIGPEKSSEVRRKQIVLPVFTKRDLDEWKVNRPGQGARTDLPVQER